ncbi:uncharacterized protein LOC134196672 [Corticium candelabrum]|uniref:uncharacterized protein LOC134196672 n=1 Tax=Corticium candelabrum TaxID=121492 RepID=UPI002E2527F1|nr:uncharacterized protein LOC134196672 [Corticium candelabrum]
MQIISTTRARSHLMPQLLLAFLLVNVVAPEWNAAYNVWANNLQQCRDDRLSDGSSMPQIDFSSQLIPSEQAVANWSFGLHEWLDVLNLTGPCLPENGTEKINHLKWLADAAAGGGRDAARNVVNATYAAYCLWAQILYSSGQGHLVVIPGYRESSTLLQDLDDAQTVMRNAFHLSLDRVDCTEVNTGQCERKLDNSTLTTDDRNIGAICGNAVTENSEECDDGNRWDGDGCSSYCTIEGCPVSITSIPTSPAIPTEEQSESSTEATATDTDASGSATETEASGSAIEATATETATVSSSSSDAPTAMARRRRSMHSPDDGLHPNSTLPPAMPTSEATPAQLSFCTLHDCVVSSLRQGTVHLSNFALHTNHTEIDPQTIRELSNGRALMAQVMTILRHHVMFPVAKLDSLKRNLAITALDALEDIYPIAVILEDGAIWIRLTGVCCELVHCCDSESKFTWRPVHNWFKCHVSIESSPVNLHALGTAIWECIQSALEEMFQCDPEGWRYIQ